ncbi:MAG: GNAT family N-acetyltransferase [Bacteroidota bacterium]
MDTNIRKVRIQDIDGLKEVLDSTELFPSEYLDDMIDDFFNNINSEDIWFTYILENRPIAIGYCAPEKLTNGTFNLYAIAVKKEFQGRGIGQRMMSYIEKYLIDNGMRILIVETSSLQQYNLTRQFYNKLGYIQEATIRDFWNKGEDKIIFWKKLA